MPRGASGPIGGRVKSPFIAGGPTGRSRPIFNQDLQSPSTLAINNIPAPVGGLTAAAPQPDIPQVAPPTGGGGPVASPPTQEPSQAMAGLQAAASDTPTAEFQQPLVGMLNPRLGQRTLPNAYSGLKVLTY